MVPKNFIRGECILTGATGTGFRSPVSPAVITPSLESETFVMSESFNALVSCMIPDGLAGS